MTFWCSWNSWAVELMMGGALAGVALLVTRGHLVPATLLAMGISLAYERWLDRNGWSWADVSQRAVGIALGLGVGWVVR
jgi:hypothetical protein